MNKMKTVILLVSIVGIGYLAFDLFIKPDPTINEQSLSNAKSKSEFIKAHKDVVIYDKILDNKKEMYEVIPYIFWRLDKKQYSSEEIETRLKELMLILNNKIPGVSNAYAWLIDVLPVTASRDEYTFDYDAFVKYTQTNTLYHLMDSSTATRLLNNPSEWEEIYAEIDFKRFKHIIDNRNKETQEFVYVQLLEELSNGSEFAQQVNSDNELNFDEDELELVRTKIVEYYDEIFTDTFKYKYGSKKNEYIESLSENSINSILKRVQGTRASNY